MRQILVIGAESGDERSAEMPLAEVELGGPTGLGHGRLSILRVTKGMDHVVQGVATVAPLGDATIRFGMVHSHFWNEQGVRREMFGDKMVELVANPSTDDEEGEN